MSLLRLKDISTESPYFKDLLQGLIGKIKTLEPNSTVYIFGSFINKKFTAESDLDIAILIPDSWKPKDFLDQLYSNGPISSWPIDLLVFRHSYFNEKSQIGGVCFDIAEEGIELYPEWRLQ